MLALGVEVLSGTDPVRLSGVYESEPWGPIEQDPFLNMVIEVTTSASPEELLERCRDAEARAHRVRGVRFGPRTLDCDVLLVGDEVRSSEELTVPHPLMFERSFVLVPLRELAPELVGEADLEAATGELRRIGTLSELG